MAESEIFIKEKQQQESLLKEQENKLSYDKMKPPLKKALSSTDISMKEKMPYDKFKQKMKMPLSSEVTPQSRNDKPTNSSHINTNTNHQESKPGMFSNIDPLTFLLFTGGLGNNNSSPQNQTYPSSFNQANQPSPQLNISSLTNNNSIFTTQLLDKLNSN